MLEYLGQYLQHQYLLKQDVFSEAQFVKADQAARPPGRRSLRWYFSRMSLCEDWLSSGSGSRQRTGCASIQVVEVKRTEGC